MNRRKLITALLALPAMLGFTQTAKAIAPRVQGGHTAQDPDTAIIGGSIMLTREEVESVTDVNALLRAKADNIRAAFLELSAQTVEQRGWAVVEYARNTTMK